MYICERKLQTSYLGRLRTWSRTLGEGSHVVLPHGSLAHISVPLQSTDSVQALYCCQNWFGRQAKPSRIMLPSSADKLLINFLTSTRTRHPVLVSPDRSECEVRYLRGHQWKVISLANGKHFFSAVKHPSTLPRTLITRRCMLTCEISPLPIITHNVLSCFVS